MTFEMNGMQVLAPAKINLSLKVCGRRDDGFHEIETLIAPIGLCDQIEIVERSSTCEIEFHCDDPSVPAGDDNLILRAVKSFFAATKVTRAVSIDLKKRIPHGAVWVGEAVTRLPLCWRSTNCLKQTCRARR